MTRRAWIGVDPGSTGGAIVLLDFTGKNVQRWWVYTQLGSGQLRVRSSHVWYILGPSHDGIVEGTEVERTFSSVHEFAAQLKSQLYNLGERENRGVEYHLALEGLFVPRTKQAFNPTNVLKLSESCGELLGPLRAACAPWEPPAWAPLLPVERGVFRPLARHWRPVSGIESRTPQAEAEAQAITLSRHLLRWCGRDTEELTKAERGAVHEAALIARAGHVADHQTDRVPLDELRRRMNNKRR